MWDKYTESFYQNLSLITAKKYEAMIKPIKYFMRPATFTFAEAGEYLKHLLTTRSFSGLMFRNHIRLFDYMRFVSEEIGYCCCAIVRYHSPTDPKVFEAYMSRTQMPLYTRAMMRCEYDGMRITKQTVRARKQDYDYERKMLFGKYALSPKTAELIERLIETIDPGSRNQYIFHPAYHRSAKLIGDYYFSYLFGIAARRRFETLTNSRLSAHGTKKRHGRAMPDGRLVYYSR